MSFDEYEKVPYLQFEINESISEAMKRKTSMMAAPNVPISFGGQFGKKISKIHEKQKQKKKSSNLAYINLTNFFDKKVPNSISCILI